ncbi:MAG: hypothetical protein JSS04_06275 [Proteobacteria bacterium]|nr:hypothetical protein [Pseudomonadota bacterium]
MTAQLRLPGCPELETICSRQIEGHRPGATRLGRCVAPVDLSSEGPIISFRCFAYAVPLALLCWGVIISCIAWGAGYLIA